MDNLEQVRPPLLEDRGAEVCYQCNEGIRIVPHTGDVVERALQTIRDNEAAIEHAEAFLVSSRAFRKQSEKRIADINRRLRASGYKI